MVSIFKNLKSKSFFTIQNRVVWLGNILKSSDIWNPRDKPSLRPQYNKTHITTSCERSIDYFHSSQHPLNTFYLTVDFFVHSCQQLLPVERLSRSCGKVVAAGVRSFYISADFDRWPRVWRLSKPQPAKNICDTNCRLSLKHQSFSPQAIFIRGHEVYRSFIY